MKKGKLVLQGTVPELIHKANGKVWEISVSPQEARQWQTKTTVANLRHEGKEIILRIISDNMPSERAVPCEATLEDLYLFYFPTEEGGNRMELFWLEHKSYGERKLLKYVCCCVLFIM